MASRACAAGTGAQPGEHPAELGQLPVPVEIGDEPGDTHQVDGSLTEDLVGDRHVTVVCVAHIAPVYHRGLTVCLPTPA